MNGDDVELCRLDEGSFNKVYTIDTSDKKTGRLQSYVFRIPLPIYPYYKIECDVATTEFTRHFTTIPVPIIYAYDSSLDNELGLEWMLMQKVVGAPLADSWLDLKNEDHVRLVKQIAGWQDELIQFEASKIGGLYMRRTETDLEFFIGLSVSNVFYMDRRILYQVNRGPFNSERDFARAALQVQLQELKDSYHLPAPVIERAPGQSYECYYATVKHEYPHFDDDDAEEYRRRVTFGVPSIDREVVLPAIKALSEALPRLCPLDREGFTSLAHNDISARNTMVDGTNITAILDWEHVEFLPWEYVQQYPTLLSSQDRSDSSLHQANFEASPEGWKWLSDAQDEIIQTHLRPIYKEHLKEIGSVLEFLNDDSTFWEELKSRVFNAAFYEGGLLYWVQMQLEKEWEEDCEPSEDEKEDGHSVDGQPVGSRDRGAGLADPMNKDVTCVS